MTTFCHLSSNLSFKGRSKYEASSRSISSERNFFHGKDVTEYIYLSFLELHSYLYRNKKHYISKKHVSFHLQIVAKIANCCQLLCVQIIFQYVCMIFYMFESKDEFFESSSDQSHYATLFHKNSHKT